MEKLFSTVFAASHQVVTKQIEGELIIVPLDAGMGDLTHELYALNATGVEVWKRLDGSRTIGQIVEALSKRYDASRDDIADDVAGLIRDLAARNLILEVHENT